MDDFQIHALPKKSSDQLLVYRFEGEFSWELVGSFSKKLHLDLLNKKYPTNLLLYINGITFGHVDVDHLLNTDIAAQFRKLMKPDSEKIYRVVFIGDSPMEKLLIGLESIFTQLEHIKLQETYFDLKDEKAAIKFANTFP
ncbi:MAG: hypothetical protein MI784_02450 [Cytophagales bacterium]|nr:hypothetical protein [Cytophagales bacterium]